MEIIGYSERGAMNALFYGMALGKNGDRKMKLFLKKARIEDSHTFNSFKIYNEFSLSEFGDPDIVIIANRGNDSVVFFVEAKVSEGATFDIIKQKKYHEEYICKGTHLNGHASNIFFQFRLKHYFFEQRKTILEPIGGLNGITIGENDHIEKTKDRNGNIRYRKIGNNFVVNKFANIIKECVDAYYIAIVPEQTNSIEYPKDFPKNLKIYCVSWMDIINDSELGDLLKGTFDFNKVGDVSQILNRQR